MQTANKEMKEIEKIEEIRGRRDVSLRATDLREWHDEERVIDYGMIMICREGRATIRVNFSTWTLTPGAVITLFPGDMIMLTEAEGFRAEALKYSASLLREASLQLEQTVYSQLRADRCRTESPTLTRIINNMFALLGVYFGQPDCICLDQLVLLQLKAFFMGFYDYIYRHPHQRREDDTVSPRIKELFNRFMMEMESRYRESRDVGYYASLLHITPKYLNLITRRVSGHTAKTLIDQYVVLQLKLSLRSGERSAKELAWNYHFSDLSFFCRYFKQHTGMTPMEFVRSEKGGATEP